jgi:hypothetical protein
MIEYALYFNLNYGMELYPPKSLAEATTENGILYLTELIIVYDIKKKPIKELCDKFDQTVLNLRADSSGLFHRFKYNNLENLNINSHDNYSAISAGSVLCGLNYHNEITNYGNHNWWIFNNDSKMRFVLPFKIQDRLIWTYYSGDKFYYNYFKYWYWLNMFISTHKEKGNTSAKLLYLVQLYPIRNNPEFTNIWNYYVRQMAEMYGENWIHELLVIYFPKEHPLVIESK